MAKVKIRLYATFRDLAGTDSVSLEAEDLEEVLRQLGDRFGPQFAKALKALDGLVILVNGRNTARTRKCLAEDDEVAIFPPVSGG